MAKYPDFSGNACAAFSSEDKKRLWDTAKRLADSRGVVLRIAAFLGDQVGWIGGKAADLGAAVFGVGWQEKVTGFTEDALWLAQDWATVGLDPTGEQDPWDWFNKVVASLTGGTSGFFGLPGVAVDIPITTLLMMRSIAEIARANGEDLSDDETKKACLQVFAFGGPGTEDDDVEVGYWAARGGLAQVANEVLVRRVATVFGAALTEKAAAIAVPLAGAVAGGTLNWAFMDFYQEMARVHFSLRALERKYGDEAGVKACFDRLVCQVRENKKLREPGKEAG